jgi:small subunit ribosomal protein S1
MTATTEQSSTPQVAVNDIGSAEDFLAAIDATIKYFNDGDIVSGTIVKVDRDEVLLDIGYKTEGVIPSRELSIKHDVDPSEVVDVGDEVAPSTSAPGARSRRSRRRTASSPAPSSRSSRAA